MAVNQWLGFAIIIIIFSILGLLAAIFLLAITPDLGVFATVSKVLSSGFNHAVPVVIGIVVGDLIFLLFAIYGLSLIAETFSWLFSIIKYIGGGYLIFLGIKLWRSTPSKTDIAELKLQSKKFNFLVAFLSH